MNEDFQEDLGLDEQAVEDEMRASAAQAEPDFSQGIDLGDPALTAPTVAPLDTNPIQADPDALSEEDLTMLAVQHIQGLGGDVQFPDPNQPELVQNGGEDALVAHQFDQLAQTIAVSVSEENGAEGAAQDVYQFITQLGPEAVEAYQTNPLFQDMVDTKIDSIVSGYTQGLEEEDRMPMPASEEVGGSTEKELRAGLGGHRQAFEKSGLGDHMSFDDFIRDLEL